MKKLDKEVLAQIHVKQELSEMEGLGFSYGDIYSSIESSYEAGLEYAENHYLNLIEEKNKDISRIQERRTEITEEATRLKQELQQAEDKVKLQQLILNDSIDKNLLLNRELQQAKELLKKSQGLLFTSNFNNILNTQKEIEEFLNK